MTSSPNLTSFLSLILYLTIFVIGFTSNSFAGGRSRIVSNRSKLSLMWLCCPITRPISKTLISQMAKTIRNVLPIVFNVILDATGRLDAIRTAFCVGFAEPFSARNFLIYEANRSTDILYFRSLFSRLLILANLAELARTLRPEKRLPCGG